MTPTPTTVNRGTALRAVLRPLLLALPALLLLNGARCGGERLSL